MKCEEALRFLSPFLDSELDPRTSFDVAQHLEACSVCARRFAREQALEAALGSALRAGADADGDAAAWARIEAAVAQAERSPRASRRRVAQGLAAAAAALVVLGAAAWLASGARLPGAAPRSGEGSSLGALGRAACHSHDAYVAGTEPAEVVTTSPDEVAAFFRTRLALAVPAPATPELALIGARGCAFGPVHVGFVMGRRPEGPVSAFVLPARDLAAFPEAQAALAAGAGRARVRVHDHEMLLATRGQLAACVVAPSAAGLEPIARALLGGAD